MKTRVQKWGNSLALRIPKSFADECGFEKDGAVELSSSEGSLLVKPIAKTLTSLDELLDLISDSNLHGEVNTGTAIGRETW